MRLGVPLAVLPHFVRVYDNNSDEKDDVIVREVWIKRRSM